MSIRDREHEFLALAIAQAGSAVTRAGCRSAEPSLPMTALSWASATTGGFSTTAPSAMGETDALENTGRLPAAAYRLATMYTTLSPCDICTGAILLYCIPRVVMGENRTFVGGENYLRARGSRSSTWTRPSVSN